MKNRVAIRKDTAVAPAASVFCGGVHGSHSIAISRMPGADPDVPLPGYRSHGAAGADIHANFPPDARDTGITLQPGDRALVPTGLRIAVTLARFAARFGGAAVRTASSFFLLSLFNRTSPPLYLSFIDVLPSGTSLVETI